MLGLTLREEFRGRRLKGTAIELSNDANTGATQVAAKEFLEITYPTHDLLKAIEAVGPNQGRPVVVIGEREASYGQVAAVLGPLSAAGFTGLALGKVQTATPPASAPARPGARKT